nr:hypothetical protein [Tanacetum cinerariifolium]
MAWNSSSPKCVHFVNTITIRRKVEEPKEGGIVEPNATKNNDHDIIVEVEEKGGEEFSGSETVIGEGESRDIKQDNQDDRTCGDTKEAEEVKVENKETEVEKADELIKIWKDMHVFEGNMSYVMDFTILENIEANIDHNGIKEVTFKTPYKDSEMDDLASERHDFLSSRVILSEDDYRRGCKRESDLESRLYMDVDKLDPSYKEETNRIR